MSKAATTSTVMPSQQLRSASQLGLILRSARKARGLNQAALASRLSLSQSRVSQLELQPENITADQLLAWCAVLGIALTVGERALDTAPAHQPTGTAGMALSPLSKPAVKVAENPPPHKPLFNVTKGPRKGAW